jgi:hypothetical protein
VSASSTTRGMDWSVVMEDEGCNPRARKVHVFPCALRQCKAGRASAALQRRLQIQVGTVLQRIAKSPYPLTQQWRVCWHHRCFF